METSWSTRMVERWGCCRIRALGRREGAVPSGVGMRPITRLRSVRWVDSAGSSCADATVSSAQTDPAQPGRVMLRGCMIGCISEKGAIDDADVGRGAACRQSRHAAPRRNTAWSNALLSHQTARTFSPTSVYGSDFTPPSSGAVFFSLLQHARRH